MVVIMVALTFVVIVLVNLLVIQKIAQRQAEKLAGEKLAAAMVKETKPEASRVAGLVFSDSVQYYSGHTWADLNNAAVPVGVDDFARKFVGSIERIETLPVGVEVKKGQPLWRILFGDRWIVQKAPVSGRVVALNHEVLRNPETLSESPYNNWLIKILPESLSAETAGLFNKEKFMQLTDRAISKFLGQLKPALGELYTDSGALIEGAARKIDEDKWDDVVDGLFGGGSSEE